MNSTNKSLLHWFSVVFLMLSCIFKSLAATLQVPADYPTIQAAVDAAHSGDLLVVSPGIYNESVLISGKDILISRKETGVVMINAGLSDIGVKVENCRIVIQDIEINNAKTGLRMDAVDATIDNLKISNCSVMGLHWESSISKNPPAMNGVILENNSNACYCPVVGAELIQFRNSKVVGRGGSAWFGAWTSRAIIESSLFVGVSLDFRIDHPSVINCTVEKIQLFSSNGAILNLVNSIIIDSVSSENGKSHKVANSIFVKGIPENVFSDITSSWKGDPKFVAPAVGDYRLSDDSPAIGFGCIIDKELLGKRIANPFGSALDLGAFENSRAYPNVPYFAVFGVVQNNPCSGTKVGSIETIVVNASESIQYYWSGPNGFFSSMNSISNLADGKYVVTAKSGQNTATKNFEVSSPNLLNFAYSICGYLPNVVVDAVAVGGVPPYYYSWDSGGNSSQINAFIPGSYRLTVKDSSGCSITKDIVVSDMLVPKLIYVSKNGDNFGDGSINNPFQTIQFAIDSACDGDSILVASGLYYDSLSVSDKNISISGVGPGVVDIDCQRSTYGIRVRNSRFGLSKVNILNAQNGLRMDSVDPSIVNVKISGCIGVGLHWESSISSTPPAIDGIFLENNKTSCYCPVSGASVIRLKNSKVISDGGNAWFGAWNPKAVIESSLFIGVPLIFNIDRPKVVGCTIEQIQVEPSNGAVLSLENSIITGSVISKNGKVHKVSNSIFVYGVSADTFLDVLASWKEDGKNIFVGTNDYHLVDNSPAINAGDNSLITDAKATDLDGKKRILGGRVDLGAYERWSFYTERSLTGAEGTLSTAKAVEEDIAAMGGVKFQVESGPEGLTVDSTSGQLTWTPTEAQGPGTYTAVVRGTAANNPTATDTQTLTLTATEVNRAPEFASANVQTTTERLAWAYTAAATDPDLPANKLTYRLVSGPTGTTVAADSGLLKWTPGEAEGGNSYDFVVEATDNGTPALSAQTTVRLDVQKINHPPTLASLSNRTIPENQPWTAQAVGQDLDLPAQSVTYSVQSGPSGLAVDSSTGVIQWTPSEAQGPGQYPVTVRVQDPEGLSAEQTFELSVTEVNAAPSLAALPHQMLTYGQTLSLQWVGSDADLPANALSYRLVSGPTNAVVSSAGQLTWTPSRAQAPSTNVLVVAVSDGSLSATNTVRVEVLDFITLVNGTETTNALALLPPAKVSFRLGLPDWVILYSLDGTPPTDTSLFYLEPFSLTESVTVWPIAFSPDFSQSVVGVPIPVTLLRSQTLSVNGGEGLVHQGPGVGLTVVSDSGLPVAMSVVSGPARLDNGQLIPTGGGVVRLKATHAGNAEWAPVTLEFERVVAKAAQTIAWTAAPDATFRSAPLQLKASASSGLPLVYSVVDGPGTIVGDRLTLTGAGQVLVRATQAGTADFEAAAADQTVVVKKASQTLTFSTVAGRALSATPITLVGAASSGLPVVYEVLSGPAQVVGDQLTLTGVGLVVLRASQPGNANYEPAIPKDQQFTVTQGQQTLTFATVGAKTFGDGPVTLSATSSAQLPVTYRVLSGPGTISGDQLTLLGAGAIAVQAIQAGNDQFQAVTTSQTITVAKAAQTLTFTALASATFSTNAVTLEAKPTSGLPVGYRLVSGAGTISGSKLTLSGIGAFTVAADQGGNTNWLAATSVTNSFVVTRGVQTITFAPIGEQVLSAGSVTLSAVSSAGLAVNFSVMSGPATVSGTKLTLLNEGTVTVRAINPGSTLWLAGQAEQSFVVRKLTTLAVTVAGNQGGTVAVTPLKDVYAPTDSVTLTATASSGFAFAGWSGDLTGSANPATLAMSANRVVTASFKDIQAPALTWDLPAAGTTGVEQVRLSGQITDNVGVTIAQWSREGGAGQALTLQANGSFSVDNLTLTVGTNRFAIVARDAAGNESKVERQVVWVPQRILTVGDAVAVQEGQRLVFPLSLNTDTATVAGLTFKLTFDPAWVVDPQVEWSAAVGQSVNNINLGTAGELTGSFAMAGVALPIGSNRIASVSFRARSVPVATNVIVRPSIVSLGSVTGVSLNQGNAVVSGAGTINTRRINGDNNANQRLDVGDAVLISRYEVGLEEKRSWDIGLNDLNQSGSLDNGDVIKALRAVVGLDPQPSPGSEGKRLASAQGLAKVLVNTNDAMAIELLDGPKATVGQPYRVAVKLNRVKGSLSGLSFALKYPASLTLTDKQVGALVPGDALPFWNESAGQISLAAIRSTAWANATGVAAVLTFVPSAGFSAQAEWPLKLEQVEITGSGFDVRPVDPVAVAIQSAGGSVNTPPQIALQPPAADGSLTLEIRAPAGATVAIEATGDLNTWIESQRITGQGDTTPVKVTLKPDPNVQAKFWRLRVR